MSSTENTQADQTFRTAISGMPVIDLYSLRDNLKKVLPDVDPQTVDYPDQVSALAVVVQIIIEEIDHRSPDSGPRIVPGSHRIIINGESVDATTASAQARIREVRDEQTG